MMYVSTSRRSHEPRGEFRLIPFGRVETDRAVSGGDFIFTREHAQQAVRWFRSLGRRLAIDYEHQSLVELNTRPDGLVPAAGWIGKLESRGDGLWATRVEWTDMAADLLRRGEYAYMSPVVYWGDDKQTKLTALGPVALTNDPAFKHVERLVASRCCCKIANVCQVTRPDGQDDPGQTTTKGGPGMDRIAELLGLERGASLKQIIARLRGLLGGRSGGRLPNDDAGEGVTGRYGRFARLWMQADPDARAEFCGNVSVAAAYLKALSDSLVQIAGRGARRPPELVPTIIHGDHRTAFRCRADLQAEFGDEGTYLAYTRAVERGQVMICGTR